MEPANFPFSPHAINADTFALEEIVIRLDDSPAYTHKLSQSIVTIGRESSNDIVLKKGPVSRHHLRLEWRRGIWYVTDLDSTNGTKIESRPLTAHKAELWPFGASLRVGSYTLELRQNEPEIPEMTEFLLPEQVTDELLSLRSLYFEQTTPEPEPKPISDPFSFSMWPRKAVHNGRVFVAIQNEANVQRTFRVQASAERGVQFSQQEWVVKIPAGMEKRFAFIMRAKRRPLIGESQHIPFNVQVVSENEGMEQADGTIEAEPQFSNGVLALAGLGSLLAAASYLMTLFI